MVVIGPRELAIMICLNIDSWEIRKVREAADLRPETPGDIRDHVAAIALQELHRRETRR